MWVGRSGAALQAWEVLELIICTGKQASARWSCWRRAFRWAQNGASGGVLISHRNRDPHLGLPETHPAASCSRQS